MKTYILLFSIITICSFAQGNSIILDQEVTGIITSNERTYLTTKQGIVQISKTNIYTEYYKEIYKDSTIINPNTEMKEDYDLSIIPFISPNLEDNRIDFNRPLKLGIFLQAKGENKYYLTPFAQQFIDSLSNK